MKTQQLAKRCRLAGKLVLIFAVIFLIGDFLELHIERSRRPAYIWPEHDEQRIVTCYLYVFAVSGFGSFLLWLGSFFDPKDR